MTNRELAKAFASGATEGANSNHTMFISGDTIYSCNKHWPLARRAGRQALVNGDKYGVTTSNHTSLVASRLSHAGFEIVWVPRSELV